LCFVKVLRIQECDNKPDCPSYISSQGLTRLKILDRRTSLQFRLTLGYNYVNVSLLGDVTSVSSKEILVIYGDHELEAASLAIDTSSGGIISDMFAYFDDANSSCDIYKLHKSVLWRFYARVYLESSSRIGLFKKTYSSLGVKNMTFKAYLLDANRTEFHSKILLHPITVLFDPNRPNTTTTVIISTATTLTSFIDTSIDSKILSKPSMIDLISTQTSDPRIVINSNLEFFSLNSTIMSFLLMLNKEDLNGCLMNCSNNGFCSLLNHKQCQCNDHYIGSACQISKRPCSPQNNPCLNNSTCVENIEPVSNELDYQCVCSSDELHFGRRCEIKRDVCMNETCSNNGNCIDNSSAPTCSCFLYYYGERCQHREHQLDTISDIIRVTMIIAIVIILCFYALIVFCDLTKYFLCGVQAKNKSKKTKQLLTIRFLYKNS
jgi:hypothetical protein